MWVAAKLPFGFVLLVIFLAVVGAKKILGDLSPEESGYRTELTVIGKIVLGLLFGVSIVFAFALLLVFVVVLLRS